MNKSSIFLRLVKELEIPHTSQYTNNRYEEYPYKYTLFGLSQLLHEYGVDNDGIRLDNKNDLKRLSTPFIADFSSDFVIVTSVTTKEVRYDWYGEQMKITLEDFYKHWSGVVLLAYPSEESVEPDYKKHLRDTFIRSGKRYFLFVCFLLISGISFLKHELYKDYIHVVLIFINTIGIYVSVLLLMKQLSIQSDSADRICNLFKKSSCSNVLETKASKFFNLFGWSEIGLAFFTVNLLTLVFYPQGKFYLAVISVTALPYTLWSIWYQKFRAKSWCPLCLIVQLLLWLQFIGYLSGNAFMYPPSHWQFVSSIGLLAFYGIILFLVNQLSTLLVEARQAKQWKFNFNSLKAQNKVFYKLLESQPQYDVSESASSILFGDPKAELKITVFSNPYCNPCARMHERLHILDNRRCCIQYIFNYFYEDLSKINKYFIAVYQTYGIAKAMSVYDHWYKGGKNEQEIFFAGMQLDIETKAVIEEFERHRAWQKLTKFTATPTVLVNGHKLPYPYQLEDMQYLVER